MSNTTWPQNWGEVEEFVKANGLDREEYFSLDDRVDGSSPVWTPETWRIPIWLCEGSNEGFYLHVDEIRTVFENGQRREGKREPRMLGKFWDHETAMEAQQRLWRHIYGFRQPEQEPSNPRGWTRTWVGG